MIFARQKAICLLLACQVGLVGALGTGLHSLLGCCHGARQTDGTFASAQCQCGCGEKSAFQRRRETQRMAESESAAHGIVTPAGDVSQEGCSGGCSICDLLEQYHSATAAASTPPLFFAQLAQQTIEVDRVDANVTTRLAESRGPPVAARI